MMLKIFDAYINEDGEEVPAVYVDAPTTLYLQVIDLEDPNNVAPAEEWTFSRSQVHPSDVLYRLAT